MTVTERHAILYPGRIKMTAAEAVLAMEELEPWWRAWAKEMLQHSAEMDRISKLSEDDLRKHVSEHPRDPRIDKVFSIVDALR